MPFQQNSFKESFALDDNNLHFVCRQECVAWLPMSLFTLDHTDKILYHHCYQGNQFLLTSKLSLSANGSLLLAHLESAYWLLRGAHSFLGKGT